MRKYGIAARTTYWQKLSQPLLVGIIVSVITLVLWWGLVIHENDHIKTNVVLAGKAISEDINTEIKTRKLALIRMADRWMLQHGTFKANWEADATNYWQDYPGYQALQWVDSSGHIRWVVPFAGNQILQNRNYEADASLKISLDKAKQTRKATITNILTLTNQDKGFLINIPLFLNNSESQLNTADTFDGYIVGVFQQKSLLDAILDKNLMRDYAIAIFEGEKQVYSNVLYQEQTQNFIAQWSHQIKLPLDDLTWKVCVAPTPELITKLASPLPNVILFGGFTAALLISRVLYVTSRMQRYAQKVEMVNADLSYEIEERHKVEAALQTYVVEIQDLYNNAPCGYHSLDNNGNFVLVNDTELKWLGYTREELIGKKFSDFLSPKSVKAFEENFRHFQQSGSVRDIKYELVRCDGTNLPVLLSATAIKDATGNFLMSRTTVFNITQQQAAERERLQADKELRWQEALLRAMANASPLAFYVVDERTNKILYFNHRFCEIWSIECLENQDNLNRRNNIGGCPDCQPTSKGLLAFRKACKNLPIEETRHIIEDEINLDDGRFIRRCTAQIRDKQDKYFGRLYIFEDITERKQDEMKLRNLTTALESAVEGIAQLDLQGRYVYVNQTYALLLGYQPENMMGLNWQISVHSEDLEKVTDAYQQMLKKGKSEIEARALRHDGSIFDKQIVMVKACNQDQQAIGHYCFVKDISDRREVERFKDEFVSVVSHELRTPLTSIRGSLGLVANGVLQTQPDKAQRMLEIAVNNSDRLIRLINDILDIERIESGKVTMSKQICDSASLMAQSIEVMQAMAEKAEVSLSNTPVSATIWSDPDRIIQTLTNLLSNAIKFSPPGSTVELSAQVEESHILFQVKDQGRGIPSDKIESIFGRFQQVDASDSRKKGGTGLGLAICRSIVQHHDGQIWAESEVGQGSNFYVSLPLVSHPKPSNIAQEAIHEQNQSPKVLIIEDDIDLAQVLVAIFEGYGIKTYHSRTGREAMALSQVLTPNLLVLDVALPEIDGFALVDWLRQHKRLHQLPLVVYSARDLDECDRERLNLGPTLFLTKGRVTPEEFEQRAMALFNSTVSEKKGVCCNAS